MKRLAILRIGCTRMICDGESAWQGAATAVTAFSNHLVRSIADAKAQTILLSRMDCG